MRISSAVLVHLKVAITCPVHTAHFESHLGMAGHRSSCGHLTTVVAARGRRRRFVLNLTLCVLSVFTYAWGMAGAIAHDQAQRLRAALDRVLLESGDALEASGSTRDAFLRLVDVLESSPEAVVLPSDAVVSTQKAADLLGVSRMTVVRLIDRGELSAEGGGIHRRIAASELARYQAASAARRRTALHGLAQEISEGTPPDQVISTR